MKKWIALAGFLAVGLFLAAVGFAWGMGVYNRLVTTQESVSAAWGQVEVVLQRRYDLIPNLVETVKGYAKHEQETFQNITKYRSQWGNAKNPDEKMAASQGLEGSLARLLVVLENYPQLKANENFLKLQDELAGTENRIAVERQRYNQAVLEYNLTCKRVPGNIVAKLFGFEKKNSYVVAPEKAQEAPKVAF